MWRLFPRWAKNSVKSAVADPVTRRTFQRVQFWSDVTWEASSKGALTRSYVREFRNLLRPWSSDNLALERVGRRGDGGYVMDASWREAGVALSIGVGDEVSWDLQVAEAGIHVWQFDHTIARSPAHHPLVHWEKVGLGIDDQRALPTTRSLRDLITFTRAEGRQAILKIDVEGHEWLSLADVDLSGFDQVLVELHAIDKAVLPDHWAATHAALRSLTAHHSVIHLHANNCCGSIVVGGVQIPRVLEVTLLSTRRLRSPEPMTREGPLELDCPNVAGRHEVWFPSFWKEI